MLEAQLEASRKERKESVSATLFLFFENRGRSTAISFKKEKNANVYIGLIT
jgi:hypothetical protein